MLRHGSYAPSLQRPATSSRRGSDLRVHFSSWRELRSSQLASDKGRSHSQPFPEVLSPYPDSLLTLLVMANHLTPTNSSYAPLDAFSFRYAGVCCTFYTETAHGGSVISWRGSPPIRWARSLLSFLGAFWYSCGLLSSLSGMWYLLKDLESCSNLEMV